MTSRDEQSSPLSYVDHPHPLSYTPLFTTPSPSEKLTPIPFVNSPQSMTKSKFLHNKKGTEENPISVSSESRQSSIPPPTHTKAATQTSPSQVPCSPLPFISVLAIVIPQHSLRVKEHLNYAKALELRNLIHDTRLITPMHAYCELHSLLLALYQAYHALLNLEAHPELHTIQRSIKANLIEALHQSGAHSLLHTLKGLLAKIPKACTFCMKCYHLSHFKENCHYYQCVHCKMYWPNHEPGNCISKPFTPEIGKRWSQLKEETPSPPPLPMPLNQGKRMSSKQSQSSNSSGISKRSKGKNKASTPHNDKCLGPLTRPSKISIDNGSKSCKPSPLKPKKTTTFSIKRLMIISPENPWGTKKFLIEISKHNRGVMLWFLLLQITFTSSLCFLWTLVILPDSWPIMLTSSYLFSLYDILYDVLSKWLSKVLSTINIALKSVHNPTCSYLGIYTKFLVFTSPLNHCKILYLSGAILDI